MKHSLLAKALHDTLTDTARKRVSREDLNIHCANLVKIIQQSYQPEIIIAIDTGGSLPAELIGQMLGLPVIHITVRRNINIRRYDKDIMPLRWIMRIYHHYLFHKTKPTLITQIDKDVSGKNILIIDDVFHTGATIDVAIEYLKEASVSDIRTAALSYVSTRKPDFSILPAGNYCFPWSKDFVGKT